MGPIQVLYWQKSLYGAHAGPEWDKCPDSAHMGPIYTCLLGWSTDRNHFSNHSFPRPKEAPYEI